MNDKELEKFIQETLSAEAKKITPPRGLLLEIIKRTPVTKNQDERYYNQNRNAVENFFSAFWKINKLPAGVLAGTLLVIAVIIAGRQFGAVVAPDLIKQKPAGIIAALDNQTKDSAGQIKAGQPLAAESAPKETSDATEQNNFNQPLTAESVDEAVVAILAASSEEDSALILDDADEKLMDEDSEAINNFTQIYDESEI